MSVANAEASDTVFGRFWSECLKHALGARRGHQPPEQQLPSIRQRLALEPRNYLVSCKPCNTKHKVPDRRIAHSTRTR